MSIGATAVHLLYLLSIITLNLDQYKYKYEIKCIKHTEKQIKMYEIDSKYSYEYWN